MRSIQYNKAISHLGIFEGEGPCQYATPIVSYNDGFLFSQTFDQTYNIAQQCRDSIPLAWLICVVVATQIGRNNSVTLFCQEEDLVPPGIPELGKTMEEHNQWSRALRDIVHANTIGDDVTMLPSFSCCCHNAVLPRSIKRHTGKNVSSLCALVSAL